MFCGLFGSWVFKKKRVNPNGRNSLGMENRYAEGRTQDVADDQKTPPRRPWADSSGSLGLWRGQTGGRMGTEHSSGQGTLPSTQLSCCGSPPPSHSPQQCTLSRYASGGGLHCGNHSQRPRCHSHGLRVLCGLQAQYSALEKSSVGGWVGDGRLCQTD